MKNIKQLYYPHQKKDPLLA